MVEVAPPERIVFTYGYASGRPIPPGGSRVTIRLETEGRGTQLVPAQPAYRPRRMWIPPLTVSSVRSRPPLPIVPDT